MCCTDRGVNVVMTRSTDTLIALSDRGRIANAKKGDVFVSIHVNAANPNWKQPGAARGFETYFLSEARTEDARRVEAMENEVVKYEIASDVGANDPLSFIVHDMEQNQHLRESSELAATVQRSLAKMHPGPNRGVKQAGFRVLVTAFMPAVLVEIGFGTNDAEARYLRDPKRQREIASVDRRRDHAVPRGLPAALERHGRSEQPPATSATRRGRLAVDFCGIRFQNPILLAAGTAAYGEELDEVVSLDRLGGIITKAVSLEPRHGAPAPRVAEFDGGMINAVGLANPGVARGARAAPAVARAHAA